mgnify:CR=1 FL=1
MRRGLPALPLYALARAVCIMFRGEGEGLSAEERQAEMVVRSASKRRFSDRARRTSQQRAAVHAAPEEITNARNLEGEKQPWELVTDSCQKLTHHIDSIEHAFDTALNQYKPMTEGKPFDNTFSGQLQ